ncbi:adenylate/guanylate cyclase domain-containing protein [Parvularcula marina]|uniref:Adenylate/guanylate cyclase domain-containing protein n=1 Tax=Parvularcula marina TaxID=2292771 RepID=A0A371RKW3_9PROT|nr:adenylate/guanylate cyclase domain-containing protein [Parvularcula marina]RFB06074.1 adenylate/guanylate cyclase domain-containing protein [Parvularcula marina]
MDWGAEGTAMLEQRLQQRPRLILIPPAILVLLIALSTVMFARAPGAQPREAVFDLFMRTAARPAADNPGVAIVDIDEESLAARGPWPWPRSALARLVDSAASAGARGVIIAVPVEGTDPLSPDAIAGFFPPDETTGPALEALSRLPTTNAALADAGRALPTAYGAGPSPAATTGWDRSDVGTTDWLTAGPNRTTEYVALPAAPVFSVVDPGFAETGMISVTSLPQDPDGIVRRTPILWTLDQRPVPAAGFAPFVMGDGTLHLGIASRQLRQDGAPPVEMTYGTDKLLRLDQRAGVRLWLPRELDLPTVQAWRVFEGGTWTTPLNGRVVFIGESVSPRSRVMTSRGEMTIAQVHAHLTEQLAAGVAPLRPGWSGMAEAFLAILAGLAAIGAAMYLKPGMVVLTSIAISLLTAAGFFALFGRTGMLLDPTPIAAAAIGAPLTILGVVIGNILMRDDALRGAFHGALPPQTMAKLQTRAGGRLLNGVRREVVVLSSRLRIPEETAEKFKSRPDDFIRFTAAANDALRRTILAHQGTVDFGEDGRLLAYWNVPEAIDHPVEKACACALRMIDDINSLSEDLQTAALAPVRNRGLDEGFADTSIEIGLASSTCFAGPVGRGNRNRYAVIGDAVGLASSLRRRATQYGPTIITDDVIFDALRHHYAFLDLDVLRLSTEEQPRTVYGLVGNPFLKASKSFRQLADIQRELVMNWRTGDLAKATLQLQRLRAIPGVPDVYVDLFEARLAKARGMDEDDQSTLVETITL